MRKQKKEPQSQDRAKKAFKVQPVNNSLVECQDPVAIAFSYVPTPSLTAGLLRRFLTVVAAPLLGFLLLNSAIKGLRYVYCGKCRQNGRQEFAHVWIFVPSLSPFVTVKRAADQFSDLVRLIKTFNLKAGIENSLDAKLQNALKAYQAAFAKDRATACNQMGSFIYEVQAQTSKALTQAQATQLISAATQIKVVLGCR